VCPKATRRTRSPNCPRFRTPCRDPHWPSSRPEKLYQTKFNTSENCCRFAVCTRLEGLLNSLQQIHISTTQPPLHHHPTTSLFLPKPSPSHSPRQPPPTVAAPPRRNAHTTPRNAHGKTKTKSGHWTLASSSAHPRQRAWVWVLRSTRCLSAR